MKKRHIKDPIVEDFCDPAMLVNQSIRIRHCSTCALPVHQNGVQITRVADGWTWWCYRCEHGGKIYDIGCGPADTLARLKHMRELVDTRYQRECKLPDDVSSIIPDDFRNWIYSYELDDFTMTEYGMVYSDEWQRLIIPVYISGIYGKVEAVGKMIAWTGRSRKSLTEDDKKKWHLVREYGIKYVYGALLQPDTKILVLVEDMISAIKLHTAGYNVVCLLTTYVPNELYLGLKGYDVRIWLDPDAVGKSLKEVSKFSAVGIRTRHLAYHRDPKDCPFDDIPGIIEV